MGGGSTSRTVLPAAPLAYALGLWGRSAFFGSPRLLLARRRARAVDSSHFPGTGARFGRQSVSLRVAGHGGAVGALDGGGEVLGRGAGL